MRITAFPLCGSKNVGIGGIRDGVHPQEFLKQVCKNCGWTGTPLEFDTEEEYQYTKTWGHTIYTDAFKLACEAGVKRLGLFHHNQDRIDLALDEMVQHS